MLYTVSDSASFSPLVELELPLELVSVLELESLDDAARFLFFDFFLFLRFFFGEVSLSSLLELSVEESRFFFDVFFFFFSSDFLLCFSPFFPVLDELASSFSFSLLPVHMFSLLIWKDDV